MKRMQKLLVVILVNISCRPILSVNRIEIQPKDLTVFEGENASFEVQSTSALTWVWFRIQDNTAYKVNDKRYVIFVNGMRTASNLTVLNVTKADDQTNYVCRGDFSVSSRPSIYTRYATLTVITPLDTDYPKCTIDNIDSIHVGETVNIFCTAIGGVPRPSLNWFENNIKIKETIDFVSQNSSNTYLNILSISLSNEDNGVEFKCKADGKSVVGNQSCSVVPLSIKPNVSIIITKMSYDVGDSLNITCSGEGIPRITEYNWFFNNEHVTSSQSMFNIIGNGTILEILELQTEHLDAEIKCKVSIPSGLSANKSITLSFTSQNAATNDLIIYIVSGSVVGLLILLGLLAVCIKTKIERNYEKQSRLTAAYANHDVSLNQVESNRDWYNSEPQPEHPKPMSITKSSENDVLESAVPDIKQIQALSLKEKYSLENISEREPRQRSRERRLSTRSVDDLYAEPEFNNTETTKSDLIEGLYAKPNKPKDKRKLPTQSRYAVGPNNDVYTLPIRINQTTINGYSKEFRVINQRKNIIIEFDLQLT
ncbi:peroxidasin homolog [Anneissia japonica]|uniref:peroxidasin homolog n=1 Tax=Anneissia japonica TaxID=1529436 RepID=UPI0014256143|nr:peroxidasin homolog [Anneissia japonica]